LPETEYSRSTSENIAQHHAHGKYQAKFPMKGKVKCIPPYNQEQRQGHVWRGMTYFLDLNFGRGYSALNAIVERRGIGTEVSNI
jgi:hypothetical protein